MGVRRFFDYPYSRKSELIATKLPIVRGIYGESARKVGKAYFGEKIKITAYLDSIITPQYLKKRAKWSNKYGLNLKNGFYSYKLNFVPSKNETYVRVISDVGDLKSDLPYELKLMKIDEVGNKRVFYLSEYEPTTLKMPKIEQMSPPPMKYKKMLKSFGEFSSLGIGGYSAHIIDSIISNYVGSDFIGDYVDGTGSSYVGNEKIKLELEKIKEALSNRKFGIPISDFGIVNFLNKKMSYIENLRKNSVGKLKTISWHMSGEKDLDLIKKSEFKYATHDSLGIFDTRNLENNLDFLHSLLHYSLIDKRVTTPLFGKVFLGAMKVLRGYLDEKKDVLNIMDMKNMDTQVGRMTSFYLSFGFDEEKVIKAVKNSIELNIGKTLEEINLRNIPNKEVYKKEAEEIEISIDPRVRVAFYLSDRTEEDITEKLKEVGFSEKTAKNIFNRLNNVDHAIYSPDGVHYYFLRENKFKFKIM